MVIITKKQTKPRAENDFYPTPYALARLIVGRFVTERPAFALDPGCGNGVFGYALQLASRTSTVCGIDIVKREWMIKNNCPYDRWWIDDYLSVDLGRKFDLIIGNPPYNDAEAFIRKSIALSTDKGKIIFLLKLAFLESKKRARGLFREFPPTEVSVLAGRPSFDGTGKTNDYAFAVFVWDVWHRNTHPLEAPKITWFDWN